MARSSMINPAGSSFVAVHRWAVEAVGFNAAAVLAQLDFLDRAKERSGMALCSRDRLILDLQGIVGKNSVDAAIKVLVELNWIFAEKTTQLNERNITTTKKYGLNVEIIRDFLNSQNREFRDSQNRESGFPEIGNSYEFPKSGIHIYKNKEKETTTTAANEESSSSGGGSDLFFDDSLADEEIKKQIVADVKKSQLSHEEKQAVLDELSGCLRLAKNGKGKEIANPIRYVAALVKRAQQGQFTKEQAISESKRRENLAKNQQAQALARKSQVAQAVAAVEIEEDKVTKLIAQYYVMRIASPARAKALLRQIEQLASKNDEKAKNFLVGKEKAA